MSFSLTIFTSPLVNVTFKKSLNKRSTCSSFPLNFPCNFPFNFPCYLSDRAFEIDLLFQFLWPVINSVHSTERLH